MAGYEHPPHIVACFGQRGSVVKARHQDDQIGRLATKCIMDRTSDLIGGCSRVVMFTRGRGGDATGIIAANRVGNHGVNGRG